MARNDKYGKNAWKVGMLNTIIALVVIIILAAIAGGGYFFIKPRYDAYQETKAIEKAEEEKRIAKEKAAEEEAEKKRLAEEEAVAKAKAEEEVRKAAATPTPRATNTPAPSPDYIIADSNSRYLSNDDVKNLSIQQVNYAKNEIYARHGRKFTSRELQEYFNSKPWYSGTIDAATFDANYQNYFNDYEIKNTEFLSKVEYSMSPNGYQLDQ